MNDEIREILNNVEINELKHNKWYCSVEKDNMQKILDYITNLQQENDDLKNRLENAVADCNLRLQENEDYKSRCEKAIEYIKTKGLKEEEWQNGFCIKATATYTREEIFDLLNILQNGSDEK